jgi:rhamnose utilization protein RhaD (predicted bifunctional aldolase and dehydrogenase)
MILLEDLAYLSSQYGLSTDWVQAAGGNTSVKDESTIYIKKSGIRLTEVTENSGYLAIQISRKEIETVCQQAPEILEEAYTKLINEKLAPESPKPSIELSFHALGDTYVVHTHHTLTNIFSCSLEGQAWLKNQPRLATIDYIKPGILLTQHILNTLGSLPSITILFNHGLIISAGDKNAIEQYTNEVVSLLSNVVKMNEPLDIELNADAHIAEVQKHYPSMIIRCISNNYTQHYRRDIGAMYPDFIVFCGPHIPEELNSTIPHKVIYFKEQYFALAHNSKEADFITEVFQNHAKVQYHIYQQGWTPSILTDRQVQELIHWDLEKYRQQLIRAL